MTARTALALAFAAAIAWTGTASAQYAPPLPAGYDQPPQVAPAVVTASDNYDNAARRTPAERSSTLLSYGASTEWTPPGVVMAAHQGEDAPPPPPHDAGVVATDQAPAAAEPSCGCAQCEGACSRGEDACGGDEGCGESCGPCCCKLADLGDPWKLGDACFFKCNEITVGGYLAQSFVWNPYQPSDRFNGPLTWTDRANDYQMNELYFFMGQAANNEGCGFDWGWRVDALWGTNYRWDTSAGFETHWGNGTFYGAAVPAAYLEAQYDDLTVKFGRFISPVGFYTVGQGNNFFPYIPYTYQYGEPFTHTGIWGLYKLDDQLTVGGGITHGWDSTDNTGNPHAGGLITATYTIDENRSFAYVGVVGPEPNFSGVNPASNGVGYTNRYLQTLVYTHKFSDDVTGALQSDFGTQHDAKAVGDTASWYGINSYLYWRQTCRMQWGLNAEWFRDDGGFRVGQLLPSFGSPNAAGWGTAQALGVGFDGSFYRLGFGPKYYFTPNVYGRAAFVADWYSGDRNNGALPFDDLTKSHQQAVIFDLVATF